MKTPINYLAWINIELGYTWFDQPTGPRTMLKKLFQHYTNLHQSRCISNLHHVRLIELSTSGSFSVEKFCSEVNRLRPQDINNDGEFARLLRAYFQIYPHYLVLLRGALIIHLRLEQLQTTLCITNSFFQTSDKVSMSKSLALNPLETMGSFHQTMAIKALLSNLAAKRFETQVAARDALTQFAKHKTYAYKRDLIKKIIQIKHAKDQTDDIFTETAIRIAKLIHDNNRDEFVQFLLRFFRAPFDDCNWDLPATLLVMFINNFPEDDRRTLINNLVAKSHPDNFHVKAIFALQVLKDYIDEAKKLEFMEVTATYIEASKPELLCEAIVISEGVIHVPQVALENFINIGIHNPNTLSTMIKCVLILRNGLTEELMRDFVAFFLSSQTRLPELVIVTIVKKIQLISAAQRLALFRRLASEYERTITKNDETTAMGISHLFHSLPLEVCFSEVNSMLAGIDVTNPDHAMLNTIGIVAPKFDSRALIVLVDHLVSYLSRNRAASGVVSKNLNLIEAKINDRYREKVCIFLCGIYSNNESSSRLQIIPILSRYLKFVPLNVKDHMLKSLKNNLDCAWFSYHISDVDKCNAISDFARMGELSLDLKSLFSRFLIKCMFDESDFELRDGARASFDSILGVTEEQEAKDYLLPHLYMRFKIYMKQEFTYPAVTLEMEKYCRSLRSEDRYVRAMRKHVLNKLTLDLQDKILGYVSNANTRYQH